MWAWNPERLDSEPTATRSTSWVTLDKTLMASEFEFIPLLKGDNYSTSLTELLRDYK